LSIEARLETADHAQNERGAPRRTLHLGVSGRFAGGEEATATVHNISATGMLVETTAPLTEGETIAVELPEAGDCQARIVWIDPPMHGCRFVEPLAPAALSAAQLRGAVRGKQGDALPVSEEFGARLHRLRTERGLSLAEVADRLGVSKPTVWAWEPRPAPGRACRSARRNPRRARTRRQRAGRGGRARPASDRPGLRRRPGAGADHDRTLRSSLCRIDLQVIHNRQKENVVNESRFSG
jgi:hypothetical protein